MSKMILYKYRTFDNWEYFIDIIGNERLYATTYDKLNDPMEGHYRSKGLTDEHIKTLKETKMNFNICSLSFCNKDIGLWVFYANEGRGCCIEVELDTIDGWYITPVDYQEDLPEINIDNIENNTNVESILYRKLTRWKGEREYRCTKYSAQFLPVKVKRIILGYGVDDTNKTLVKAYIDSINQTRQDKITVEQINKKDLAQQWCACEKVEDCVKCKKEGNCPMTLPIEKNDSSKPSIF